MMKKEHPHANLMLFDIYKIKLLEDIDTLMIPTQFRNIHTIKINKHTYFIYKMVYEEQKGFYIVVKLPKILIKIFI